MSRTLLAILAVAALLYVVPAWTQDLPEPTAQEEAAHAEEAAHEEHGEEGEHDNVTPWKALNFALLAGALIYFLRRPAGRYFASRTESIRKGIDDATAARKNAEDRAAEMERRLGSLETEIAQLRSKAREETVAEEERLRAETAQALARIHERAGQEILSTTSHARNELRAEAARLALELAERNVRQRMTPELASGLLSSFVNDLARIQGRTS